MKVCVKKHGESVQDKTETPVGNELLQVPNARDEALS
jgi:hypothetical protein